MGQHLPKLLARVEYPVLLTHTVVSCSKSLCKDARWSCRVAPAGWVPPQQNHIKANSEHAEELDFHQNGIEITNANPDLDLTLTPT